ncbi:hypothetical protein IWX90DRAFT_423045 [Phyllosticta citrichinensis]|uniref:Proteophosphoglycan ppg4 n=1 Tax=Phyllosticta citrichinensis TaxID=1130410 RepID=A0ABR1Y1F8_9PEZI
MSGNPFRRSVALNTATTGLSGTAFNSGNNGPLSTVSRTKKHVRVASPPPSPPETSSPEPEPEPEPRPDPVFVRRLSTSHHAGSPPPAAHLAEDSYSDGTADEPSDDSPAARDDDPDDAPLKTNAANIRTSMDSTPTSPGVPNPFARTLETIEQGSRRLPARNDAQGQSGKAAAAATRASMDVDSFKRLLLTGRADAESHAVSTSTGATIQQTVASAEDARGSAELSAISRHALFGALHGGGRDDSPRSSYERSASDGVDDDDHATLIGGGKKPDKKKPPPPRHKHGKSITLTKRGPQVVSFADFAPSFVSQENKDSTGRPRSQSDVNKPLPPRPRAASGNAEKDLPVVPQAEALSIETTDALPPQPSSSPSQQRRKPPTPPLSRRYSQLRSVASEPRSRSNSTSASASASSAPDEPFSDTNASSSSPSPGTQQAFNQSSGAGSSSSVAGSKPPPPPPARRSAATSVSSSSDLSNTIIATPSRSSSRRSTASSIHQPNPSAFAAGTAPSTAAQHAARPLRLSSSALEMTPSSAGAASSSTTTSSHNAPPPPPPPRRGSSKNSFDLPRPSASVLAAVGYGGSGGSGGASSGPNSPTLVQSRSRTASAGSERLWEVRAEEEQDEEEGGGRGGGGGGGGLGLGVRGGQRQRQSVDMLSELDKLQREVEALRERSAGAGGAGAAAGRRVS